MSQIVGVRVFRKWILLVRIDLCPQEISLKDYDDGTNPRARERTLRCWRPPSWIGSANLTVTVRGTVNLEWTSYKSAITVCFFRNPWIHMNQDLERKRERRMSCVTWVVQRGDRFSTFGLGSAPTLKCANPSRAQTAHSTLTKEIWALLVRFLRRILFSNHSSWQQMGMYTEVAL